MATYDILQFDISGTILSASATEFATQNLDGTQTILVSSAGDFTYPGPGQRPSAGTIDEIRLADAGGTVGVTVTDNLPTIADLAASVFTPVDTLRASITWFNVIDQALTVPDSLSPTQVVMTNTDATKTVVNGFGFTYSPIGAPIAGTVTSIQRFQSDGTTLMSQVTGLGVNLILGLAVLIDSFYSRLLAEALLAGDNLLTSSIGGNDTAYMMGGDGNDTITGSGGGLDVADYSWAKGPVAVDLDAGTASGAAGLDLISNVESIFGSDFDDIIIGSEDDDVLSGSAGNDTIDGGEGADMMFGDAGDDQFTVDDANDQVIEFFGEGSDTVVTTLASYTLGANVENLIFDGDPFLDRLGIGNELDNYIQGYNGTDTLSGGGGDDTLEAFGGSGNQLFGEAGDDLLHGALEIDLLDGGIGNDTLEGSGGDDTLVGRDGDDSLDGGMGNDLLIGGAGADDLNGGDNNDVIWGDVFDTNFNGGTGYDYLIFNDQVDHNVSLGAAGIETVIGQSGDDVIDLTGATSEDLLILWGGAGNDTLTLGASAGYAFGELGNDTLSGGAEGDNLIGGGGADDLSGNGGNDVLWVDELDTFDGGDGIDWAIFDDPTGAGMNINVANRNIEVAAGANGNDTLDARGDSGGLVLFGNTGADHFFSGNANDHYYGGGTDNAKDVFHFNSGSGIDSIWDWEDGVDEIDLSGAGITGIGTGAGLVAISASVNIAILTYGIDQIFVHNSVGDIDAGDFLFA